MFAEEEPKQPDLKNSRRNQKRNADDDEPNLVGIKTLGGLALKAESQMTKFEVRRSEAATRSSTIKGRGALEHEEQTTVKSQRSTEAKEIATVVILLKIGKSARVQRYQNGRCYQQD